VSVDRADEFVSDFLRFSHGTVVSDNQEASGEEIGLPKDTYRRIRIDSIFGEMTVIVTNGHLPFPYGRETTGYEVKDLSSTLRAAKVSGVAILVPSYSVDGRQAVIVEFPGGYVAEIHQIISR
jgi:hypothetical protein